MLLELVKQWKFVGLTITMILLGYLSVKLEQAQEAKRDAFLKLDSMTAVVDTTRQLHGILADSLNLATRRVVQLEDIKSELEEKLNQQTMVKGEIIATIDTVIIGDTTKVVIENNDIRTADFTVYEAPITLGIHVELGTDSGTADITAAIDPLFMGFEVSCSEAMILENHSFRQAHLNVITPDFIKVEVASVTQEAEVCNPTPEALNLSVFQKVNQLPWYLKVGIPLALGVIAFK